MHFLDEFMGNNDTLKERMLTLDSFGQPLDNEANDVPLYDQYNTGLAATQQNMSDRINLSIDPRAQPRCGVKGTIPSAEEGTMPGAGRGAGGGGGGGGEGTWVSSLRRSRK